MTCKKAQGFLGQAGTVVAETVDARKQRFDGDSALALLDGIDKIVAVRGKKIEVFDLKKDRPPNEVLLAHLLGPTGNLRAPTARIGKTLLVGFSEDVYKQILGT
jgi:arsenate reductase-like glutaredoxin family protein